MSDSSDGCLDSVHQIFCPFEPCKESFSKPYLKENDQKGMAEKKKEFYEKLEEALNLLELKEQN